MGRIIKWGGDGIGYTTPFKHYWIIVSRDDIGFEYLSSPSQPHLQPLLVVPMNSYIDPKKTPVGASDILIEDESRFKFPLDGGPTIVRCGQLRTCRSRKSSKIEHHHGVSVCDELLKEIDEKLVQVLGLEDYIERLVKERTK